MSENHRPDTGDPAVDRVLDELEQALSEDPEGHVDALAQAHQRLQARLAAPADGPKHPVRR